MNISFRSISKIAKSTSFATFFLATGCVYQLGTSLPPDLRSVHVPMFTNRSGEPLVEAQITQNVIREIQRDGNLKVTGADSADLILEGIVTGFSLEPIQYERDSGKKANEYRLSLEADITITKKASSAVLLKRTVKGENSFLLEGDLASAKTAAFPKAAADLAHKIVECLIEYW